MNLVVELLIVVLWLYFILLIGRLILDYIQMFARSWRPTGPVLVLAEIIYTVTDPPLRALRKVIPPLRIGSISLDLSFLVLLILMTSVQRSGGVPAVRSVVSDAPHRAVAASPATEHDAAHVPQRDGPP